MTHKTREAIEILIEKCRKIVECDTARISQPLKDGKMFFIIGFNRNTKDNEGQWLKNGEPFDFDYTEEHTVASGYTEKELIKDVKKYKRLCGMTWEQYFKELRAGKIEAI